MELWDILDENGNKTGRTYVRGSDIPLADGEYHLVVHVWIVNSKGEFLVSKRTPNKDFPNMWECTGGAAVAGDDSLQTAIKEVKEELGVVLNAEKGKMLWEFKLDDDICNNIYNVWLFVQDIELNSIVLQENETCDAMLADKNKIIEMMENGEFIDKDYFPYIEKLFAYCENLDLKERILEEVSSFKFTNPIKSLGSYKSEMTLSQVVMFFEGQGIGFTKTMIQHYGKMGILPPLENKRYYDKRHVYALLIIHILKDIYSLDDIKAVFAPFYEDDFEASCNAFISMYEEAIAAWQSDFPEIFKNLTDGQFEDTNMSQKFLASSLLMAQSAVAKELAKQVIKL